MSNQVVGGYMRAGFDQERMIVVMGMPRGGTTSLYHILEQHPDLYLPFRKETAFFSFNSYKGERWYRDLFRDRGSDQWGVDISPQYFIDLRSIARIKTMLPDAKIILSVRDPVDWIISSFFQTNKFEKKPSFREFLEGYTITGAKETLSFSLADGYVTSAIQLLMSEFGENLLLYKFSLFKDDPVTVLQALERFVGISDYFTQHTYEPVKVNSVYQHNLRWLTWFLSREAVISTIDTVFPRAFIKRARVTVDAMTMPKKAWPSVPLSEAEINLAERRMSSDREWVDQLFSKHQILLGTGQPPQT
jgi:hypothetical protein